MLTNIPPVLVAPNNTLSPVLSNPIFKVSLSLIIDPLVVVELNLIAPLLTLKFSISKSISFARYTGFEYIVLLQVNSAVPLATAPVVCDGALPRAASNVPVPVTAYTFPPK